MVSLPDLHVCPDGFVWSKPMVPFWLVGEFTTHFRTGILGFDPWPHFRVGRSLAGSGPLQVLVFGFFRLGTEAGHRDWRLGEARGSGSIGLPLHVPLVRRRAAGVGLLGC